MQRSTFKVLFYVKRQSEKSGQLPVMGRITINGTMSQFSCKLSVRSSLWDAKANKAAGRSVESQRINEKLENIKTNIGKQYQRDSLQLIFYLKTPFCYKTGRAYACSANFFLSRSICFW